LAKVTLFSKPQCPLCDDARLALERVRTRLPFELEEIDITSADVLRAQYGERVPVVAIAGREAFEYVVDEPELERLLATAPGVAG
jgi:glutaredoxin